MPHSGVSVPRGNVHRGDWRSDDLELEVPGRRTRSERRERSERRATSRVTPPPVLAPEHDPYDLHLDLHVEFDLSPPTDRAASRQMPSRAAAARRSEPLPRAAAARRSEPLPRAAAVRRSEPLPRAAAARRYEPLPRVATARLSEPPRPDAVAPERRTVTIHGRPSDRYLTPAGARRREPAHQRVGFQPDRVAMWAVLLGLVMLLVAATSSHAAVLSAHSLATLVAR